MRKMKILLGILGGIAAVVFFIFKGMNSNNGSSVSSSSTGGMIDSSNQSKQPHTDIPRNIENHDSASIPAYTPPVVDEKWKCVPYEQVGEIKATYTEKEIKRYVGEENVVREQLGREWGETIPGTLVYPNSPNQLHIEWRDGRAYEVIESIRIEGDSSKWQTPQGIRIGTTLEELRAINGGEFDFYGFEWDYAGKVDNWRNGTISEGLVIYLTPDNPAAIFPDMIGDTVFSTTYSKVPKAQLRVAAMEIKMRKGIHF